MLHYTQNDKFVFFNAVDAQVQLTVEDAVVGAADSVDALVELLLRADVRATDRIMFSSDMDFASEEGFATDSAAHELLEAALETSGLTAQADDLLVQQKRLDTIAQLVLQCLYKLTTAQRAIICKLQIGLNFRTLF